MRTIEQWTHLAQCAIRGITEEQAKVIGRRCFDAEATGENYAVWHQSALYFGTICHCAKCDTRD